LQNVVKIQNKRREIILYFKCKAHTILLDLDQVHLSRVRVAKQRDQGPGRDQGRRASFPALYYIAPRAPLLRALDPSDSRETDFIQV
jgi:hypothetical protein